MGHGTCESCGCTSVHNLYGYEPVEKFLKRINTSDPDGCWEWRAGRDPNGYGRFNVIPGITMLAHRYSWAVHHGDLPSDMLVCHKCDNPPCVNPAHLFLGTYQDNSEDMVRKGRHRYGAKHRASDLIESDVLLIREKYAAGGITQQELAHAFGVTQGAISQIVNRAYWTHI